MSLVVRNISFMTTDPERLADFWSAATGYTERRDSRDEILLAPHDWGFPRLTFQRIEAPRSTPGGVHLDLTADDMAREVERLVRLGATRLWSVDVEHSGTTTWTAMHDPGGNEFCVVQRPPAE